MSRQESTDGPALSTRIQSVAASDEALVLLGLVTAELFLSMGYFGLTASQITAVRYILYPFVWINVAVFAVWKVRVGPATDRRRRVAAAVAVAYFVVIAVAGGLVGLGSATPFGLSVSLAAPPGYAPLVAFDNGLVRLALQPYKVVGYLALAYLVYATAIEAAGSAATGILGLLSCVSCTWPVLASVAAGVAGGSAFVTSQVMQYSLDLSTAVFVVTVALLYWRPGFGD